MRKLLMCLPLLCLMACTSTVVKFSQAVYATDMAYSNLEPIALVVVRSTVISAEEKNTIKMLCNRITHVLDDLTVEAHDLERIDVFIPASRINEDNARLSMTKADINQLSKLVKPAGNN